MGYYMQGSGYGAQGGFFGSIMPFVRNIGQAAVTAWNPAAGAAIGAVRRVGTAITSHPIVSAVAGAAAASGTTMALSGGHTGPAGTLPGAPMPGGVRVSGHLHLHGRGKKGMAAPGGPRTHRRMNVCNPRALRRAIRRAHGFQHLALKVLAFSRPHGKPKGHPYFKRAKKRTH